MKDKIKILLRKGLLFENDRFGVFKDRTDIHDYDNILFGVDNIGKESQGLTAEIQFMSPEQYFREVANQQRTSYDKQLTFLSNDNVEKIMDNMRDGVKYSMPYINFRDNTQEGRHRVFAAKKLGYTQVPVLVLDEEPVEHTPSTITKSYNIREHKEFMEFIRLFNGDEEEYYYDDALRHYIYYPRYNTELEYPNFDFMTNNIDLYYYEESLPNINDKKYLQKLVWGVTKYQTTEFNKYEIEGEYDGFKIEFSDDYGTVTVTNLHDDILKENIIDLSESDMIKQYDEYNYKLNPEIVKAWMEKYPQEK